MISTWLKRLPKLPLGVCAAMLLGASAAPAGDNEADLRTLVEQQQKQIQALKERLDTVSATPVARSSPLPPR